MRRVNRPILIIIAAAALAAAGLVGAALAESESELPPPGPVEVPPDPFRIFASRRAWLPVLDALEPCLPVETPAGLAPVVPFVLGGRESAARRALELVEETHRKEGKNPSAELRLWLAVAGVRVADTPQRRGDAIRVIDQALADGGGSEARVCAYLERARAQLNDHRAPEASASALLALREGAELPIARIEAARFLRAEAMLLSRRTQDARTLYETLVEAAAPRIAAAARLRLIEQAASELDPIVAWKRLRARLEDARANDLDLRGFQRLATEFALRAGDSRRALLHVSRVAGLGVDKLTMGLATIRKADVLVARGRAEDALIALERIAEQHPELDVRRLAKLRIVDHGLDDGTESDQQQVLREAAASTERGLSLHARALLLHRYVVAGEVDLALDEYARLAYDNPDDELAPTHRDDLDATLLASIGAHCPTMVRRLGGRRKLLLRQARVSEPFIALADCYLALGMPAPALATYSVVTRAFGSEVASRLTLRIARASLGADDLPAVRAALRAYLGGDDPVEVPVGGLAGDSWPLFEVELALRDGRNAAAAKLLLPIVQSGDAPLRALRWLGEQVAEGIAGDEALIVLEDETSRWQLESDPPADPSEVAIRAGIALIVADRLLARGEFPRAHYYYGIAIETLPENTARARARFHRATLSDKKRRQRAFADAAVENPGSELWSRLAALELRAAELRVDIGRRESSAARLGELRQ